MASYNINLVTDDGNPVGYKNSLFHPSGSPGINIIADAGVTLNGILNSTIALPDGFLGSLIKVGTNSYAVAGELSGTYTPTYSNNTNIGTFSHLRSFYSAASFYPGSIAYVTTVFTAVPTTISAVFHFTIPPFFSNFSSTGKGAFVGGTSFVTATPTILGSFRNIDSVASSNRLSVELNVLAGAVTLGNTFYITASFIVP